MLRFYSLHPRQLLRIALCTLLALALAPAHAATRSWTGGSGSWHDPLKWSGAMVPNANDDVVITNLIGGTITVNAAAPAKSLSFNGYGTISGTGALDVSGLASFGAFFTTTITTNGSRLPLLSLSPSSGTVITFTDPALTTDSLATFTSTSDGSVRMNVGARNYGTINLNNGYLQIDAPITVTNALNWAGGGVSSSNLGHTVTIASGATLTLSNGTNVGNFLNAPLINNGTATWSGNYQFSVGLNGQWTNNGSLTVQVASPLTTLDIGLGFGQSASKPLINNGTLRFNHSGTVQFDWRPGLLNHGLIEANSGNVLFRWENFEQYAGETRLNGGTLAGSPKCCNLDNNPILLRGGKLSGSGTIIGGIENDGGIVELNGALSVSNVYGQTAKGSLKVTVAGTTPGTHFGTMNVFSRPGFGATGRVALAGNLIVDHTPGYSPRSGERFNIITTSTSQSHGRTTDGSGNMSPAFAAFASGNQVFISEPAAALAVQAKADAATSTRNQNNGYTLRLVNLGTSAISVSSVQTQIASLFVVQPGSTTGLTTTNPSISPDAPAVGQQTLYWALSPAVAIPAGGARTLRFSTVVSNTAPVGTYSSKFTVYASTATSPLDSVAAVDVVPSSALTSTAITMTSGRQQEQNGVNNFFIPRSSFSAAINVRMRISCPPEYEPCGNLRTVFVGQDFNGRFVNVRELTLDPNQNATLPADELKRGNGQTSVTSYGFWGGQIPGSGVIPGVPLKLFPDWDAHRPCISFNGDGFGLYPVGCVRPGEALGTPQLYDPSGIITDAVTAQPIAGATVTLLRQLPALPDVVGPPLQTRQCRTIDTRPGGISAAWSGSAADTGIVELPGFSPPQISPNVNPQVTGSDGRYGWDVVTGCWYVKVSAPGYAPKVSALVGVPPAVTDLHVSLQPAAACNLDLDGDGTVLPHTDALLLARYLANTTPGVDLTANAKNPASVVTTATIQAAVEAMRDGLAVDIDGDGAADNKDAIIVMRALLGFRGAALTQGLSLGNSLRQTGTDLRAWLISNCGLALP